MSVVSIEKFAKEHPGEHAQQVEGYSLGRFMDDLHSEEDGRESESDRGTHEQGGGE